MLSGLVLYPNFLYDNPNSRQFERLLQSLNGKMDIHIVSRPGPLIETKQKSVSSLHLIEGSRVSDFIGGISRTHFRGG